MINLIKRNRLEVIAIMIIILLAAFLRFYRLSDYMTFLGDEGRDAIVVKAILVNHHFPSLGPATSVGNIYLGPLYYYMMAIAMAIWWLNPIAAAAMVAVIGVATVCLIYYLARVWFGFWPAVLSAISYTISSVNIFYSRSSWNPNPAPFFALLSIIGIYKARQSKNFLWLVLSGIGAASALQMHYLAMILLPILGLLWLNELFSKVHGQKYHYFIFGTIMAIAVFGVIMLPLLLFDLKHNFMNFRAMANLFGGQGGAVSADVLNGLFQIPDLYFNKLIGRYMAAGNLFVGVVLALIAAWPLMMAFRQNLMRKAINWPWIALGCWLVIGLLGLSLYRQAIYDHYLGFVSPAPFLLLGGFVGTVRKKIQVPVVLALILILLLVNLPKSYLFLPPGYQLARTQKIAQFVIDQAGNKPFNFALIAKSNYDAAYQYYLDLYDHKPKVVPVEVTDQLFVVCEDLICQPIGHPKYEIAAFGWVKLDKEFIVDGIKVYRLVENPEGKIWQENHTN